MNLIFREKRMLPPPSSTDLTSTPKKILRLSQTKSAIDQAHALEQSISPVPDDDRDEVASNTSVAVSENSSISSRINSFFFIFLEFIRIFKENLNKDYVVFIYYIFFFL